MTPATKNETQPIYTQPCTQPKKFKLKKILMKHSVTHLLIVKLLKKDKYYEEKLILFTLLYRQIKHLKSYFQ